MFSLRNPVHLIKRLRSSRAVWNMGASYFAFFSASAWALVSIPIAVRYLDRDSIGLWTVVNAFLGYFAWMDMGIAHATGRLMAPAVAKGDQSEINRWWTATSVALWLQAFLVLIIGVSCTPLMILLLGVSPSMQGNAIWLFSAGIIATALSFPLRSVPGFLAAQERFHWVPLIQGSVPWTNLLVFFLLLRAGWGVKAYAIALSAGLIVNWTCFTLLVKNGPQRPRYDRAGISRERFTHLLKFSGSLLILMTVDSFINTLPAMILARMGGLGTVPIYNFSTKGAGLGSSLVLRTYQAFQPAWQRSFVSGNLARFRSQYEAAGFVTLGSATCGAAFVLALNPLLVSLLAGPGYLAGNHANVWIAVGVITFPLGSYFQSLLTLSGSLGRTPIFFIAKLFAAGLLGVLAWHYFGLAGIAAVFALLPMVNGVYGFLAGGSRCGFTMKNAVAKGVAWTALVMVATVIGLGFLSSSSIETTSLNVNNWPSPKCLMASSIVMLLGLLVLAWGIKLNHRRFGMV